MSERRRDCLTVSPPTIDRSEFARCDAALAVRHAPFDRGWIMARFGEGLQIRMLRPPFEGFVVFQPGKLAWRPLEGVDRGVVIHDLRVPTGPLARDATRHLLREVEGFARYFGYTLLVAITGDEPGLLSADFAPGRRWVAFDKGPGGARLLGRVLQGPHAFPSFPADWDARGAALGPGLVIQTTGESTPLEARARFLCAALEGRAIAVRHERLTSPAVVQNRAARPSATFSVHMDGAYLGGPELTPDDLLAAVFGTLEPLG